MQTEIDQYLMEQNCLLNQQNKLLAEQKRLVESTNRFITDYLKLIQRARTKLKQQNPQLGNRERNDEKN